ncbi:MAG: hypothetical protein O6829_06620, partial [Alphaproteobacteria bacterium]|nr:hypothetical protein [Alphaproteobacteria bacterium]
PLRGPYLSDIHLQYDTKRKEYPPARKSRPKNRIESELFPLFPYFKVRHAIVGIVPLRATTTEKFTAFALKTDGTSPMAGIHL